MFHSDCMNIFNKKTDELTLVDLALVLVRRRRWLLVVLVIGFGLAAGIYAKNRLVLEHMFVSTLAVGYDGRDFLEPMEAVRSQVEEIYIPEMSDAASDLAAFDVGVLAARPDSGLLQIYTIAQSGDRDAVSAVHERVLNRVMERHGSIYDEIKSNLSRLGVFVASPRVYPSEMLSIAMDGGRVQLKTMRWWMVCFVVVFLAILMAFVIEFLAAVRRALLRQ